MSRKAGSPGGAGVGLILLLIVVIGASGLAAGFVSQVIAGLSPGAAAPVAQAAEPSLADQAQAGRVAGSAQPVLHDDPMVAPEEVSQPGEQAAPLSQSESPSAITHVVQRGDTLFRLAQRHRTTVQAIKVANQLKCDKIVVGQKLLIPVSVVACPAPSAIVCPAPAPVVVVPVCPPPVVVVVTCPPPQPVCVPVCPQPCPQVCVPVVDP
ncbi:MAG: LysM peptidoglycan-binding domain-containing protein [Anaerolineae bacterium]|nr:LysM peptidoglycan-binding domain-containing protein [Anaerolineae bacterium]